MGRIVIEGPTLQFKYSLVILMLNQKWGNKMYVDKMVKILQCTGDVKYE
jgi:hypothetical protein